MDTNDPSFWEDMVESDAAYAALSCEEKLIRMAAAYAQELKHLSQCHENHVRLLHAGLNLTKTALFGELCDEHALLNEIYLRGIEKRIAQENRIVELEREIQMMRRELKLEASCEK